MLSCLLRGRRFDHCYAFLIVRSCFIFFPSFLEQQKKKKKLVHLFVSYLFHVLCFCRLSVCALQHSRLSISCSYFFLRSFTLHTCCAKEPLSQDNLLSVCVYVKDLFSIKKTNKPTDNQCY
jgi:hypothetical protein